MESPIDVNAIARMACLVLSPETQIRYARELDHILSLFAHMDTIDLSGVEPMIHPLDQAQPTRADQVTEYPVQDGLMDKCLRLGPQVDMNLFFVPQVIE